MNKRDFPPELDTAYYRNVYLYPQASNAEVARRHDTVGTSHGEAGSPLARNEGFVEYINWEFANTDVLEIGPGANPRMKGKDARYFDFRTAEELRAWARKCHYNENNVPATIHYHALAGNFDCVDQKFDLVFSSHNIEHCQCLIKYLRGITDLLKPGGVVALIVPNKLYMFDHFRPVSEIGEVVEQYESRGEEKTVPLHVMIDQARFQTHNKSALHWKGEHGLPPVKSELDIRELVKSAAGKTGWGDCHRWVFTPESFSGLIGALHKNGYIDLRIERLWETPRDSNSFNVIMVPESGGGKSTGAGEMSGKLVHLGLRNSASLLTAILEKQTELRNSFALKPGLEAERLLLYGWQKSKIEYPELTKYEEEFKGALHFLKKQKYPFATDPEYSMLLHAIYLSRPDLQQKWDPVSQAGQAGLVKWYGKYGIREHHLEFILTD